MSNEPVDVDSDLEYEIDDDFFWCPMIWGRGNDSEIQRQHDEFRNALEEGGEAALRVRETLFTEMRSLDAELGRNFRNLLRGTISKGNEYALSPKMMTYLSDVSVEELIEFICARNEKYWIKRTLTDLKWDCLSKARQNIEETNKFIRSHHQWDITNWHVCYENILKDVLYLYAKHGKLFVHALAQFITKIGIIFYYEDPLAGGPFAEGYRSREMILWEYSECSRDEENITYDFEDLFLTCLICILKYQVSMDCGYALSVFAPWLAGAREALDNLDIFFFYDQERMRKQQQLRLAKYKIEKTHGLFVLKKFTPEVEKSKMELDGVKSDNPKERGKKRKLVIDVRKSKKQVVDNTTSEVESSFHRFTPFPSKGGFSQYQMSNQNTTSNQK
ncbi:hypothetical protein B9Z55_025787 [Caenorhabditis nigoni]|uniref:Uncharacterized protein n=1 Tax=Caenorhabditis nigoni TaxID=1611254 RepID=A0A2G5T080_9PELO|nr:hypothetical protein B9Z55_025787 [Caenorhabditis nigoni]